MFDNYILTLAVLTFATFLFAIVQFSKEREVEDSIATAFGCLTFLLCLSIIIGAMFK